MDYHLNPRLYSNASEILNTAIQQAVDLDFTLADYCADIEKILKSDLTPKIYSRTFSAGELRVDGACIVRILYCDRNKKILRCCEQTVPFSATIPVNADVSEYVVLVKARQEYLNCRALTPRRLTVHGAFTLYASVISKSVTTVTESATDEKLQVLTNSVDVCELCEFTQEQFTVAETVPLNSKNRVETIVRSEMSAVVTDLSKSMGKLNLKGEITLRMLYISDAQAGECDRFVYVFPFTQSIDAKDSDWDISDLRLDVMNYELLLKSEMMSEEPALAVDAKLCVTLLGYKNGSLSFVTDAYSIENDTDLSFEHINLCESVHPINLTTSVKSPLYLGEKNICRILDIYTDTPVVKTEIKDKSLHFYGKVNVSILGFSEEGELLCIDRQLDVDLTEPLDKEYTAARYCSSSVTSLSYRISDNNELELRLDMRLCAVVCKESVHRQVLSASASSNSSVNTGESPLILYYAGKGEKVWDIAKRYSASLKSICDENDLNEEELSSSRMLLILRS